MIDDLSKGNFRRCYDVIIKTTLPHRASYTIALCVRNGIISFKSPIIQNIVNIAMCTKRNDIYRHKGHDPNQSFMLFKLLVERWEPNPSCMFQSPWIKDSNTKILQSISERQNTFPVFAFLYIRKHARARMRALPPGPDILWAHQIENREICCASYSYLGRLVLYGIRSQYGSTHEITM